MLVYRIIFGESVRNSNSEKIYFRMSIICLQGTKIVDESHDQDTTDLHKCVAFIRDFHADTEDTVSFL